MWGGKGKIQGLMIQMEERKTLAAILPQHHAVSMCDQGCRVFDGALQNRRCETVSNDFYHGETSFPPQPVPSLHVAFSVAIICRFVSVDVQIHDCTYTNSIQLSHCVGDRRLVV